MDPELSDWTSAGGPETDRLASLMATHDRDLHRVAIAVTDDAQRASRAVLATWTWAGRRMGSIGSGSEARARLLRRVAREARRRTGTPWLLRLRNGLPLIPNRPANPDTGRDPAVVSALAPLTVEDRQMLALWHAAGLTTDEIAAQLELTGPGVRTHLGDLRSLLRRTLGIGDVDERGEALTDRDVDRRIGARLLAHLDRRATPGAPNSGEAPDVDTAARSVMQRHVRRPRPGRRPVIVGGIVLLVVAAMALPLSMLPSGAGTAGATPRPSPGTLLAVAGWSQHPVVRVDGTVEIIGWSPDGVHVAVAEGVAKQVAVYDRRGTPVRTFDGTDAAWIDANRLLVLADTGNGANLVLRTLDGTGDLLLSWPGSDGPTTIVAGGGGIAVSTGPGGFDFSPGVPATARITFFVLRDGSLRAGPTGIPLAWSPDGTRLAYMAAPALASGGYQGQLHLLDAATMTDRDVGATVMQSASSAIDPTGRHLLACVPASSGGACDLGLVDLRDGSVQASSIIARTAVAAWAPDGSAMIQANGTVLRWAPGDEPVALRWQPEHGNRVLGMATAGAWLAVGLYQGPITPQLVAGTQPPMVVVSGPGVHSLAASADGQRLAYGQLLRGSTTIVIASLPRAPASPLASAAAAPTPAPSSPAASFEGAPILALDRTYSAEMTSNGTAVSWGPHLYLQSGGYQTGDGSTFTVVPLTLSVLDITTKVETPVDVPLASDEMPALLRTDGAYLVVEAYRRLGPPGGDNNACPPELTQPVAWRILAAPVDQDGVPSGPFTVLDSGTASRVFTPGARQGDPCALVVPPSIDVADGRVAYAVEAPTAANPWATRLIVRRLADRAVVRQEVAPATIQWLGLSGDVLAWAEQADASVSSSGTVTLRSAALLDAPARTVRLPAGAAAPSTPWFLMAGTALLYSSFDANGVEPPTIWRLDLATGDTSQLAPPAGSYCSPIVGSSEIVFVRCDSGNGSGTTFVWRPGHDWVVLGETGGPIGVTIGGGWVILTDWSDQGPRLIGFPISELTGQQPRG